MIPIQCDHPDCINPPSGVIVNDVKVCIDHIDWAIKGVTAPVKKALQNLDPKQLNNRLKP